MFTIGSLWCQYRHKSRHENRYDIDKEQIDDRQRERERERDRQREMRQTETDREK